MRGNRFRIAKWSLFKQQRAKGKIGIREWLSVKVTLNEKEMYEHRSLQRMEKRNNEKGS